MKLKHYIFSRDFLSAIILSVASYYLLGNSIKNDFAQSIYNIGISVLAIVFSVYFAALALIISSGDNELVKYMERRGYFSRLLSSFKSSLLFLLIALVYSIFTYVLTSYWISNKIEYQNNIPFSIFTFVFFYSLFATVMSSLDAIRFAEFRVKFLMSRDRDDLFNSSENNVTEKRKKTG